MKTHHFLKYISFSSVIAISIQSVSAAETTADNVLTELPHLTVIAQSGPFPLTVELDPKAAAQPIPAQDGADVLRAIPGFNIIRKGGTDGDPVLRGMAGSRLGILLSGANILGGCGNRMDPPTAYVFPSAYEKVTIIKGPQTVRYGPGNSAGVVLFDRDDRDFPIAETDFDAALTLGSFGRNDQYADFLTGASQGYAQLIATRTAADDYEDGDGRRIHSAYERWSTHAVAGWTPNPNTLLELSGVLSDGEAAYADRMMDGTRFKRENLSLRFRRVEISSLVKSIELNVFRNYIDHVMDNFTLRPFTPSMMMPNPMASNPDRLTYGGRGILTLQPTEQLEIVAGADFQGNRHTTNRQRDARFSSSGIFMDFTYVTSHNSRWIAGTRIDYWEARDDRQSIASVHGMQMHAAPNPTAGQQRHNTLPAAFARFEKDITRSWTAFAALGHSQRFPDYWELFGKQSPTSLSAFNTKPERTTQIDLGLTRSSDKISGSISLFANRIDNFILIETRTATVTRNIDASTFGGEASMRYAFAKNWRADASLAYVRGTNRSDKRPLAQISPLESRLGISYTTQKWSVGGLARLVAAQNRYALNQGNIVGQDLGPTSGFAVFALNASWKPTKWCQITAGIDNLFDHTYAEHLSRGGSMVAGFPPPDTRVNEPGRTWWLRLGIEF